MNAANMNNVSETNWGMVDALTDEDIDRSEISPLDKGFFRRAKWRLPQPVAVTVHIEPDLLEWCKAQDEDYEQRMIAALRIYAEAHRRRAMVVMDAA